MPTRARSVRSGASPVISDAAYSLSPTAPKASRPSSARPNAPGDPSRARPIPRVNIQAFCEDQDTAAVIEKAAQDRRLAKAHVTVQMGGVQAAVAFYQNASTPNLVIIESLLDRSDMLARSRPSRRGLRSGHQGRRHRPCQRRAALPRAAAPRRQRICRRAGQGAADHREHLRPSIPTRRPGPVGQVIAFVGAKGGSGSSTVCHNTAFAIAVGAEERRGDRRSRSAVRHRRPRFQPGSAAGHRRRAGRRPSASTRCCSTGCCRAARSISSLFAAPGTLDRPYDLDAATCETVLDVVRENVPWIAVDVPHLWTAWAKQVVLRADHVVITAAPDLANLRNAKNLIDQLKGSRPNDRPPLLVLNQVGMPEASGNLGQGFRRGHRARAQGGHRFRRPAVRHGGQQRPDDRGGVGQVEGGRCIPQPRQPPHRPVEQKSERQSMLAPILARLRLTKTRA